MALCIFCQSRKIDSKEHVIGKWWIKNFPELMTPPPPGRINEYSNVIHTRDESGGIITQKGPIGSAPLLPSATFRVVCETCNNGWMSQIDNAMKEFITSFLNGAPKPITSEQIRTIENWMFLRGCLQEEAVRKKNVLMRLEETGLVNEPDAQAQKEVDRYQDAIRFSFQDNRDKPRGLKTYLMRESVRTRSRLSFVYSPDIRVKLGKDRRADYISYSDQRYFIFSFAGAVLLQTNIKPVNEVLSEIHPYNMVELDQTRNEMPAVYGALDSHDLDHRCVLALRRNGIAAFSSLEANQSARSSVSNFMSTQGMELRLLGLMRFDQDFR